MTTPDETIPISKFKATCLGVLERVRRTGRRVVVTRYGEAIAEVVPPRPAAREPDWLGSMRGRGRVEGDLVPPVVSPDEWEASGS
ncbi:MAG TPA: type II toxin-antitoxin system prevent-host-death family antitoxin [Longimicrobiales bacterium]|nr:type II toxin-antitoxin system prevent-host-death family antitoxin [Longimicrobiales bacterium]